MIRLKTSSPDVHVAALEGAGFEVVVEVALADAVEVQAGDAPPARLTAGVQPEDVVTVARILLREQQTRARAEALDHLERLGTIAHDINNILTPIVVATQELATPDDTLANDIMACCIRAGALLRRMLSPAHALAAVDMNGLLDGLAPILRITTKGRVLTIACHPGVVVRADPLDIERAIINLVQNAHHATVEGGHVKIVTTTVEATRGDDVPPGRWVSIIVEDDGAGMDALTVERARHGFFTTKSSGAGTGLGLVSVSRTARSLGGFVRIESAPNGGTRVRLLLPPAADDA